MNDTVKISTFIVMLWAVFAPSHAETVENTHDDVSLELLEFLADFEEDSFWEQIELEESSKPQTHSVNSSSRKPD